MVETKKNERANALKERKRIFKEFVFIVWLLKVSLFEGEKNQ
jgi:hypothetical protein